MAKSDNNHPDEGKRAGEVRHDARGHAVWHWATETARNAVVSTSQLLRKLDLSGLSLEDEPPPEASGTAAPGQPASGKSASGSSEPHQPGPTPPAPPPSSAASPAELNLSATGRSGRRRGYNPYDRAAVRPAPAANNRPAAPKRARSSWWRRLFQRR
ncbi:MAG: hypothetical protein ACHQDD_01000 [Steroidobacterales bacterium]